MSQLSVSRWWPRHHSRGSALFCGPGVPLPGQPRRTPERLRSHLCFSNHMEGIQIPLHFSTCCLCPLPLSGCPHTQLSLPAPSSPAPGPLSLRCLSIPPSSPPWPQEPGRADRRWSEGSKWPREAGSVFHLSQGKLLSDAECSVPLTSRHEASLTAVPQSCVCKHLPRPRPVLH